MARCCSGRTASAASTSTPGSRRPSRPRWKRSIRCPARFSYVGQSGALGAYWIELASRAGLGIAKWITTGNEAQVTHADAIATLARDRETRVIGAYIEDIKSFDAFAAAADAVRAAGKAIVAIKSGRSAAGRAAAAAHTASDAGDDERYDAFLRACGVHRVRSLTEMIDGARLLLADRPPTAGRRLGIVTVSGGAGVLACDVAADAGLEVATLGPADVAELRTFLPGFARPQNPVDVTGAVVSDRALMARALATLARSAACDAILLFLGSMASIADTLIDAIRETVPLGKPLVVIWMAAPDGARARIEAMGVPTFDEIPAAVAAIARIAP